MNPIGCSNMSDPLTVIIHPAPQVNLGKDTALLPSQNIMLDAGPGFNTYAWSTGATSQTIVVDSSGTGIGVKTVWVIVTDNYTCPGGDTVLINFTNHPGIEESSINAQLSIFPNPTDGYIELILSHFPAGLYELNVFNQTGKLVYSENYHITEVLSREIVDLSNLPDGMYIMQMISNEITRSEKVIILR